MLCRRVPPNLSGGSNSDPRHAIKESVIARHIKIGVIGAGRVLTEYFFLAQNIRLGGRYQAKWRYLVVAFSRGMLTVYNFHSHANYK